MAKKKTFKPRNPFIYEGYEGNDYFCDRAILHTFDCLKQENKDAVCIYTDIFHTQNQYELVQTLGRAIVQEKLLDTRSSWEKMLGLFSGWRPAISFDPMTGSPTVTVNIERTQTEYTLKSIFDILQRSGKAVSST